MLDAVGLRKGMQAVETEFAGGGGVDLIGSLGASDLYTF